MSLFADCNEFCRPGALLAPLTWFKLGGPADWLAEPRDERELSRVLAEARRAELPVRYLGLGANLIVRDAGVRGVVVRLSAPHFQRVETAAGHIDAGGGVHLTKLVRLAVHAGLAGLEILAGIPGTVGGGVRMNCGGRYGEIASAAETVDLMRPDGTLQRRRADEMGFRYRHAHVGEAVVTGARFRVSATDRAALLDRFREVWRYKAEVQPALEEQSAGCIFKNPGPDRTAGKLIDECGLKGLRRGGAGVSPRHANFIVAHPGARAADVLALIEQVQEAVYSRTGLRLEREVEVW